MSAHPMDTAHNEPGFILKAKDVPKAYWDEHSRAYSLGLYDEGEVPNHKPYSEEDALEDGALYREDAKARVYGDYWVWIPARYMEPLENEYGEVAP